MGIKPSYIKTIGTALLSTQKENFSNNFDANKQQSGHPHQLTASASGTGLQVI